VGLFWNSGNSENKILETGNLILFVWGVFLTIITARARVPVGSQMSRTANMGATSSDPASQTPVKKRRESKPRPAARPHRRLQDEVLRSRLADMQKRITVLRSKLVLLEDRCAAHDAESVLREAEA